ADRRSARPACSRLSGGRACRRIHATAYSRAPRSTRGVRGGPGSRRGDRRRHGAAVDRSGDCARGPRLDRPRMSSRRRTTGSFEVRQTTGSNEVLDRLFVYATLRKGQAARSLIANQITRSTKASTTGAIYVFPMGYAGLVEIEEPRRVVGELLWL